MRDVQSKEHCWDIPMNVEHEALFNLSPSERLLLAQDLWDSLSVEDIPLSEWQKQELDRRKAVYETNPGSGRSWDDVQRRIIERHG